MKEIIFHGKCNLQKYNECSYDIFFMLVLDYAPLLYSNVSSRSKF